MKTFVSTKVDPKKVHGYISDSDGTRLSHGTTRTSELEVHDWYRKAALKVDWASRSMRAPLVMGGMLSRGGMMIAVMWFWL